MRVNRFFAAILSQMVAVMLMQRKRTLFVINDHEHLIKYIDYPLILQGGLKTSLSL